VIQFCPYCSALHKAIANQNYCSKIGDSISGVRTNAYYFKTNNLYSGEHVSRLSIRTISDGYQYHQVNKRDLILKRDNYLIINEGEAFRSEISVKKDVEGILVAFDIDDVKRLYTYLVKNESKLLDDPDEVVDQNVYLESQSVRLSNELKLLLLQVKYGILNDLQYTMFYEEIFMKVLKQIFKDQSRLARHASALSNKKASTKEEIFKRVRISKDYIDVNFKDDLSIKELSRIAMMSPFHFVRSFKRVFNVSPHQYVTRQRLAKAKFLLRDTEKTIGNICQEVGLVNSSSFTRLFKNLEGCTPNDYKSSLI